MPAHVSAVTVEFLNSSTGLERALRCIQSLVVIITSLSLPAWSSSTPQLAHFRAQLALARRTLRLFRFLPNFTKTVHVFEGNAVGSDNSLDKLRILLEVGKYGFNSLYLLGESLTFLDLTRVYPVTWAERCLLEANKFWFYSLVCSIGLGLLDTLRLRALPAAHAQDQQEPHEMSKSETAIPGKDKHANPDPKATTTDELLASKSSLLRQKILADACDLLLPGTAVGWIQASPLSVGIAMAVSSYITSVEVWMKIAVDLS